MIDSLKILLYLLFVTTLCLLPVYFYRKKIKEIFAVAMVLFFFFYLNRDFLWGSIGVYHDTLGHEYLLLFFKQWLENGIAFGWNPYLNGGEPFYLWSNSFLWPQWALFCAINRILQLDAHALFNIYWVFQFANFGIGCLLLFLALYDNFKVALLAFITLMLSGMFLVNLGQPTGLRIIYYFPFVLFAITLALKRKSPLALALAIVLMGIALNHYIPHYIILCVGIFLFFLFFFDLTHLQKFIAILRRHYRLMLLAVMVSLMAAAPAFFLYFEMQDYVSPTRGGRVVGGAVAPGQTGRQPCVNAPLWAYRVLLDQKTWYRANIHHAFYFGIAPLLMIPLAFFRWRNRYVQTIWASALLILLLSTGEDFTGFRLLIHYVPTFDMIRHSFGLAQFTGLLLICLAGFGFKELMADRAKFQTKSIHVYLTMLALAICLFFTRKANVIVFGVSFVLILWTWLLAIRKNGRREKTGSEVIFYVTVILLIIVDLSAFYIPASKKGLRKRPHPISEIAYPLSRTFYTAAPLFHLPPDITPLIRKQATLTHLNDNFVMFRNRRLNDMFVFAKRRDPIKQVKTNYFPGLDGPICYLTSLAKLLSDDISDANGTDAKMMAAVYQDGLDHAGGLQRHVFFRSKDIDFLPQSKKSAGRSELTGGSIEYLKVDNPNRLDLLVETSEEGYLVRLENYHPGWAAFIDGEKTRIYRANYAFHAIRVPKGEHRVNFRFSTIYPYLFGVHFIVVLLGWVLLNCCLMFLEKRPRYQHGKGDPGQSA